MHVFWFFWIVVLTSLLGNPSFVYSEIIQTNYARSIKSVNKGSIVPEGAELEEVVADRVKCEVTPRGSFACTIPVDVPGGRQGVSPNLAFTYDSKVDNGVMGVGWRLSGMPAVVRCDGGSGIGYGGRRLGSVADTLCFAQAGIDGGASLKYKLIPQGSSETIFRTQTETFLQFHKEGTCGDDACYLMAKDSRGNTLHFGGRPGLVPELGRYQASEERNVPPVIWDLPNQSETPKHRGIHAWLLSRVEDIHGNRMNFDYYREDHGLYISQITYGHHATQNPTGYRLIEFGYDNRTVTQTGQTSPDCHDVTEIPNRYNRRLTQVHVRSIASGAFNQGTVRKYHLTYICSSQSGKSLLSSIQEEGSDGQSLPPYSFTYRQDNQAAFNPQAMQVRTTDVSRFGLGSPRPVDYQAHAKAVGPAFGNHLVGDINGDGRDDLVVVHNHRLTHYYVEPQANCSIAAQIGGGAAANSCQYSNQAIASSRINIGLGNAGYYYLGTDSGLTEAVEIFQGNPGDGPEYPYLGDMNGDGLKDLIIAHLDPMGDATIYYAPGAPGGMGEMIEGPSFNAGGVQTNYRWTGRGTEYRDLNWLATSGDFNGDGLTDIAYAKDNEIYASLSNGNGFDPFIRYATGSYFGSRSFHGQSVALLTADVNGDGYEDLINFQQVTEQWREDPEWWMYLAGNVQGELNGFTEMYVTYAMGGPVRATASIPSNRILFARSGEYKLPDLPDQGQRWDFGSHLPFEPFVGDVNGDRILDLMLLNRGYWESYETSTRYRLGTTFAYRYLGRDNMFRPAGGIEEHGVLVQNRFPLAPSRIRTASGPIINSNDTRRSPDSTITATYENHMGDFNCDGRADLVSAYRGHHGNFIEFSPGDASGIFSRVLLHGQSNSSPLMDGKYYENHWVSASGDFNGDGCQDLFMAADDIQGTTHIDYFVGKPGGLGPQRVLPRVGTVGGVARKILKADVDGNGVDDVLMIPALPQDGIKVLMSRLERADLLTVVNNGLGGQTEVTYQKVASMPQAIAPDSVQALSNRCENGLCLGINNDYRPIASRVDHRNGRNENRHMTYEYKNGLKVFAHKARFTDPGFEKTSTTHGQSRARVDTTYHIRPPFEGSVLKVENLDGTGRKYLEQETTYDKREGNGPQEARAQSILIYPTSSRQKIYEGGVQIQRTDIVYNNYDEYGNARDVVETTGGVATTAHTDFTHDPTEWLLSRVDGTTLSRPETPIVQKTRAIYQGGNPKERYWKLERTEEYYCPQLSEGCSEGQGSWVTQNSGYAYDPYGNIHEERNAQGAQTAIFYDPYFRQYPSRVYEHYAPGSSQGNVILTEEFEYDYAGRLKKAYDKYNRTNQKKTEYTYDGFGRLLQTDHPNGGKVELSYHFFGDPNRQLILERVAYGKSGENLRPRFTQKLFDGYGKLYKTIASGDENRLRHEVVQTETYDGNGNRILTVSDPHYEGQTWGGIRMVHDTQGRRIRNERFVAGGRPRTIKEYRFGSASQGLRSTVTLRTPGSGPNVFHETIYEFNDRDLLQKITDAAGQITQYDYDAVDHPTTVDLPNGDMVEFVYNSRGQVTRQTEPAKGTTTLVYRDTGELERVTDALNQKISFTYNNRGQILTKVLQDPSGGTSTHRYAYDAYQDLTRMDYPAGWTQWVMDFGLGRIREKRYHINGLHTQGSGYTSEFFHSEHFQEFDLLDRPRRMVLPGGVRLDYEYSPAGNFLALQKDGNPFASFTYNAQGQLLTKTAGNVTTSYAYNEDNQIERTIALLVGPPAEQIRGLLKAIGGGQQAIDLNFLKLRYSYYPSMNLHQIVDDRSDKRMGSVNTNMTQTFFYDELDRLTYSDGAYGYQHYAYDPIGNLTRKGNYTFIFGNRRLNSYRSPQALPPVLPAPTAPPQRPQRPVVQLDMTDGTLTDILLAQFNPKGKKTTATDAPTDIKTQKQKSDMDIKSIKQEIKSTLKTPSSIKPPPFSTITTTTTMPPPPPSGALHTAAAYDVVGNLILENEGAEVNLAEPTRNTWRYVYDVENHLTEVWHNNIKIMEMAYDYKGQRIKKIYHPENGTPETTTYYLGNNHEVRKIGGLVSTTTHLLGPTGILASITDGNHPDKPTDAAVTAGATAPRAGHADPSGPPVGTVYYLQDHLGSNAVVFKLVNNQPTRISHTNYLPFGEIANANSTGLALTNFGFTGQEVDFGKLMYFDARYYHPFHGRFMTPDLITWDGGQNAQAFARYAGFRNNPLRFNDPSGQDGKDVLKGIGSVLYRLAQHSVDKRDSIRLIPIIGQPIAGVLDNFAYSETCAANPYCQNSPLAIRPPVTSLDAANEPGISGAVQRASPLNQAIDSALNAQAAIESGDTEAGLIHATDAVVAGVETITLVASIQSVAKTISTKITKNVVVITGKHAAKLNRAPRPNPAPRWGTQVDKLGPANPTNNLPAYVRPSPRISPSRAKTEISPRFRSPTEVLPGEGVTEVGREKFLILKGTP